MTDKLYYADSHLFSFNANIINILRLENETVIELDKTAFFPEGGGQPADSGYIDNAYIYTVVEKDGIIYHYTKDDVLLLQGAEVFCKLDKEKRFSRMQAHSGEHIISGIAHNLFGADNVGFHMDDTLMTVDFDIPLTKEQLEEIELRANYCVFSNVRVNAEIHTCEEAKGMKYRSKLDFNDSVRIVEIEGIDLCACCAPHVNYTGEIGIIKILSSASHRGGVRITMICGITAYEDYLNKHRQTLNIAASLCAKHYETDRAVERVLDNIDELKYKITCQQTKYLKFIANAINSAPVIFAVFEELVTDELRELCNLLKEKCQFAVVLFSGCDVKGYSYCIYSEKIDLSMFIKDFNLALNGCGGGRGVLVQGKIRASQNQINMFFNEMRIQNYENAKKKESC